MDLSKSKFVFDRVQALASILLEDKNGKEDSSAKATFAELEKYMRMLRPAGQGMDHSNAARLRLRQKILNHPSAGSEGPVLLSRFDSTCETLKRLNPRVVGPFLSFLMPVSFYEKQTPVFQNVIQAERQIYHGAPQFDIHAKTKTFQPVVQEEMERHLPASHPHTSTTASVDLFPPADAKVDLLASQPIPATKEFWIPVEVERKLLLDLMYILQGVTGKHIKYDSRTESYLVDPVLGLPTPARDLVLCICELGWLYNKVAAYLKTIFNGSPDSRGLVVQAFGFSLHEEMHEYFRLLAVIERELQAGGNPALALPSASQASQPFESKSADAPPAGQDGNTGLTLLRLKAWMQEPIMRMVVLARLVDGAQGLIGGALISRLLAHSRCGDLSTCQIVQRIMDRVCAPLHTYLVKWVFDGDLKDPHNEFFISLNPSPQVASIWKETYMLHPCNLPTFLSVPLAEKIISIGKSINFLKLCASRKTAGAGRNANFTAKGVRKSFRMINKNKHLGMYGQVMEIGEDRGEESAEEAGAAVGEKASREERKDDGDEIIEVDTAKAAAKTPGSQPASQPTRDKSSKKKTSSQAASSSSSSASSTLPAPAVTSQQMEEAFYRLRLHQDLTFSHIITRLATDINRQVLKTLTHDFHVFQHLQALKKFMLLGQGDFINCLIDSLGPELKKRSSVLFKHNLLSLLESSLRASNAQYEDESILSNVSIRLLEAQVGDTGWEIFSLDYVINVPLNSIVHMQAMAKYRIAFHMLWRLKRVEWSLANTWKELTHLSHVLVKEGQRLKYRPLLLTGRAAGGNASSNSLVPHSGHGSGGAAGGAQDGGASSTMLTWPSIAQLKRIVHRCNLNRAGMMHIVSNLSAFLMFEVLETAWEKLRIEFHKAQSLDDLIRAHDDYLTEILDRALLSPAQEALQAQIQQVLQVILRFCHLEETLVADTLAALARHRLSSGVFANQAESPASRTGGATSSRARDGRAAAGVSMESMPMDSVPTHLIKRIDETVKEYSAQFDTLMTMLKEEGEKSGEILRYLTFRLDFNDYHKLQKAKGNGVGLTSTPRNADAPFGDSGSRGASSGAAPSWKNIPDLKPTRLSLVEE